MPSIIYNDDVEMNSPSLYDGPNEQSSISDESTPGTNPVIDPYPVSDGTNRISDGWGKNLSPNGGTGGTEYTDTPPVEKSPLVYGTKTIKEKTKIVIRDYTSEYLQNLDSQGFKFYAVYTDGTEDEVEYTEIYNPNQIEVETYINEAQEIAEATNQHFWHDDNGAHVTDVEQDAWKTAANANFSDLSDSKPYHNILMNSLGILLRRALNSLVSISKSAITFYDGLGNNLVNIRASFGSAGATFRENGKTKATITAQGFAVYDNDGSVSGNNETLGTRLAFIGVDDSGKPYTRIGKSAKGYIDIGVNSNDNGYIDFYNSSTLLAHIGYDAGINVEGGTSVAPYYTFGIRKNDSLIGNYSTAEGVDVSASGYTSHAEGSSTEASGAYSHAEGSSTEASGAYSHAEGFLAKALSSTSHAEGYGTKASSSASHAEGNGTEASGSTSHAEGYGTKASGDYSHAEGYFSKASGNYSHAEGDRVTASGAYSHVEGYFSTVSGHYSHAEGYQTTASGDYSHAEGYQTIASGDYSHAEGYQTEASSYNSHASGSRTKAAYADQFVCGVYNRNISNSLFEVGNGASGVNGASDASHKNAFTVLSSGSAYFNGTTSANGTAVTSDARVKTLIKELTPETSIKFIKQLQPKHYYKEDVEEYGFYAQEVEEISEFGDVLVSKDNSGLYDLEDYRLLNYQGMIAPIVSVEQNLIERIEQLEQENAELKQYNKDLTDRLTRIEKMLKI